MATIRIAIRDIVQKVDDSGERAEHRERGGRVQHRVKIEQSLSEQQSAEDDEILRPLLGPQRPDHVPGDRPRRRTHLSLARLGLIDDVRNTVSRHLERGGYVRGLANC